MRWPMRSAWSWWAEAVTQVLQGRWFDGRTSAARAVQVRLLPGRRGPSLQLQPADAPALLLPNGEVGWPERWSAKRAPRTVVVDLGPRGSLEVDDVAGWQQAVAAAGQRESLAQGMQTRWRVFAGVFVVAAALVFAFYRWGTPWAATQLTRQVPPSWEAGIAQKALQDLDAQWLKPSKVAPERQQALRARFDALARDVSPALRRYPGYQPTLALHFRRGFGANAFALPGGTIVVTDGLVELADRHGLGDDAIAGVLAHEIGHVMHRHTTRLVVEQAVLNVGLGLALGDVSTLVSMGGSVLTGLAYRRGHESEADCFALDLLARGRTPPQPMADLLLKMEKDAGVDGLPGWTEFLSSHPATPQRALALRDGRGCDRR